VYADNGVSSSFISAAPAAATALGWIAGIPPMGYAMLSNILFVVHS
jgi:hypothetical protein